MKPQGRITDTHFVISNQAQEPQKNYKNLVIIFVLLSLILTGSVAAYFLYKTQLKPEPSPTSPPKSNVGVGCKIGGCSGELCIDANSEDVYSICIYNPMYDCYKTATCEVQENGECGWTETSELQQCLDKFEKH
jgi:eight-cysteine-cluster-containing protein